MNAETLQHTVWWIACTRFGMRANQENHDAKWGDMQLKENDGIKYLIINERTTKTRQGGYAKIFKQQIRVYGDIVNPARCPVNIFMKYGEKRPHSMLQLGAPFYLQPKKFTTTSSAEGVNVWYKQQVISLINTFFNIGYFFISCFRRGI